MVCLILFNPPKFLLEIKINTPFVFGNQPKEKERLLCISLSLSLSLCSSTMEEAMASPCYSDMGVDQLIFDQWNMEQLEMALEQGLERSPSSESHTERPKKQLRTRSWSSCTTAADQNSASTQRILSFGKPDSPVLCHSGFHGGVVKKKVEEAAEGSVSNGSRTRRSFPAKRTSAHNHEHIMAERKRREKMSQRFIELSAIVPGLKKMDKATVLSDAIKYLKQLQDKVMNLEDQLAKRSIESAVLVRKTQLCVVDGDGDDDDASSRDGDSKDDHRRRSGFLPPKIEARVCDKSILIKIHCENRKGVLVQALSEIEKLHLSVVNTSVIPFPGNSLDITVASQIEEAFSMSARDLVKRLNSAFRHFK